MEYPFMDVAGPLPAAPAERFRHGSQYPIPAIPPLTAVDSFTGMIGDHCLGGIRNDNPAFGFELAFGATNDDAVVEWPEFDGSLSAAGA
jgi:hypothetical protein